MAFNISENSYKEFMLLVYQMRKYQSLYFRTRSKGNLRRAMQLEQEVDNWLKVRNIPDGITTKTEQTEMFT